VLRSKNRQKWQGEQAENAIPSSATPSCLVLKLPLVPTARFTELIREAIEGQRQQH
jgi:hypothetical protein